LLQQPSGFSFAARDIGAVFAQRGHHGDFPIVVPKKKGFSFLTSQCLDSYHSVNWFSRALEPSDKTKKGIAPETGLKEFRNKNTRISMSCTSEAAAKLSAGLRHRCGCREDRGCVSYASVQDSAPPIFSLPCIESDQNQCGFELEFLGSFVSAPITSPR
jgi:hypothetical protein